MSSELFETLALAARYLFAVLGILIVIQACFCLVSNLDERKKKLRSIPEADYIGDLVVVAGNTDLPEGTSVPVPWEGVLGSVRSCDIFVPAVGVKKHHLSFAYEPEHGMMIHPSRGSETLVNHILITSHLSSRPISLIHGSFLQTGQIVFRLRMFAGLDPDAGFEGDETFMLSESSSASETSFPSVQDPDVSVTMGFPESSPVDQAFYPAELDKSSRECQMFFPASDPLMTETTSFLSNDPEPDIDQSSSGEHTRFRRSERWEADWSE